MRGLLSLTSCRFPTTSLHHSILSLAASSDSSFYTAVSTVLAVIVEEKLPKREDEVGRLLL